MKKLWPLLLVGAMSLYGCNDDDDHEPEVRQNLYVVLDQETGLDSLARAIDLAGLKDALAESNLRTKNDKAYTIFAPDNEAFMALLEALELKDLAQIPEDTLIDVLSTHVLSSKVLSTDLKPVNLVTTLNGQQLEVLSGSNGVTIRVLEPSTVPVRMQNGSYSWAMVKRADVQASNGVVHVIDKVLLPKAAADE